MAGQHSDSGADSATCHVLPIPETGVTRAKKRAP